MVAWQRPGKRHGSYLGCSFRPCKVAEETGLPVNSSEAAQKEAAEKAEAKEADEEEEAGGWSQMSEE